MLLSLVPRPEMAGNEGSCSLALTMVLNGIMELNALNLGNLVLLIVVIHPIPFAMSTYWYSSSYA